MLPSITQTLTDWVAAHGAYAIFAIMAVDAVLAAGGAVASHDPVLLGHTLPTGVTAYVMLASVGTLGYLFGALVGWKLGRWGGRPLLEERRWLHLDAANLDRSERWFDQHGRAAVFLGRLTPVAGRSSRPGRGHGVPPRPVHRPDAGGLGDLVLHLRRSWWPSAATTTSSTTPSPPSRSWSSPRRSSAPAPGSSSAAAGRRTAPEGDSIGSLLVR